MCIICYSPSGFIPSEITLSNSNSNNPDGFGWAIRTPNGIVTGKTMDSDQAINSFLELRERFIDFDAVYHARITTHGATMLENNHPFMVQDNRTVLVHNGMLPITPSKGDTRSDTRIFAEEKLPAMGIGVLDKSKARRKLEKWMTGSKMVIMSTRSDLRKDTYILNESSGIWDDGIWYSNSSYTYTNKYWLNYMGKIDSQFSDVCVNCSTVWDDTTEEYYAGVCSACMTCLECGEGDGYCFCYNPAYEYDYSNGLFRLADI